VLPGGTRVHSLEHARPVADSELRTRVDTALPGLLVHARQQIAEKVAYMPPAAPTEPKPEPTAPGSLAAPAETQAPHDAMAGHAMTRSRSAGEDLPATPRPASTAGDRTPTPPPPGVTAVTAVTDHTLAPRTDPNQPLPPITEDPREPGHPSPAAVFDAVRQQYPEPLARNARWTMWGRDGGTPENSVYAIESGPLGLRGLYVPPAAGSGVGEWHWHLLDGAGPVMVTPLILPSSAPLDATSASAEAAPEQVAPALEAAPWSAGLRWRADDEDLYVFGPPGPEHPAVAFEEGLRSSGDRVVHVAAHAGGGTDDSAWLTTTRDIGWLRGQSRTGQGAANALLDRYGWRYDIAAPGGVDVNETLELASPHPERREVLHLGGVDGRRIRGAQRLEGGRPVGPYQVNPGFVEAGERGTAEREAEG
jgi:hypothetical protein